jgi:hypothetical protein
VREYLVGLDAAGYLCAASREQRRHPATALKKGASLAKDNGVEAPRVRRDGSPVTQGRGTQAMWDAITALDTFTHAFLAEIAQVKPATAAAYCGFLGRAGYLDPGEAGARYRPRRHRQRLALRVGASAEAARADGHPPEMQSMTRTCTPLSGRPAPARCRRPDRTWARWWNERRAHLRARTCRSAGSACSKRR